MLTELIPHRSHVNARIGECIGSTMILVLSGKNGRDDLTKSRLQLNMIVPNIGQLREYVQQGN